MDMEMDMKKLTTGRVARKLAWHNDVQYRLLRPLLLAPQLLLALLTHDMLRVFRPKFGRAGSFLRCTIIRSSRSHFLNVTALKSPRQYPVLYRCFASALPMLTKSRLVGEE